MIHTERAPDGRIKIVFDPLPEPEPNSTFVCIMCATEVQQYRWKDADICNVCMGGLRRARSHWPIRNTADFHVAMTLDLASDLIKTIEQECKNGR